MIVQVGSALGARAIPLQSAYCGAKHAVNGFTESLRTELMHEGSSIRVTVVQMPAVNTPQFSWVLSRLSKHPQPVPPIYQPEVAAAASFTHWTIRAANSIGWGQHRRHHLGSAARAGAARPLPRPHRLQLPADRAAGQSGPAREPVGAARRPGGRDFGAHGVFDDRSHAHSTQFWATRHRRSLAGATLMASALAVSDWGRRRFQQRRVGGLRP
ncbi:short chain dehydrogenase family protein [Mycobacterium xenopi 4042]|uniref:Short chain dehydrogenase family protein n=1 Tax=Mycobacterium xenopi 4042 TaxID=1299334 RepID=X8CDN2_MYCXE|nr:short chain dehydrogenase family protein [Mycobacterium xenopi 4042]